MKVTRYVLGIDVGSVAAGIAVVDQDRQIVARGYRFHKGEIEKTVTNLLEDLDYSNICSVAATVSTPQQIITDNRYNTQVAFTAAAKNYYPKLGALLTVGGEKFSLATFDPDGHYLGSTSNTSCAAGTGSFLDQQAGRLNLGSIEKLAEVAADCQRACPRIATRCAVFAKTDLIHAQQEGYQLDEISDGLCRGLAENLVDTLFSQPLTANQDIIFCGGVSKNKAVIRHLEQMTGLNLTVPSDGHIYGAIGASFLELDTLDKTNSPTNPSADLLSNLFFRQNSKNKSYYYKPLELQISAYPTFDSLSRYTAQKTAEGVEVEVDIYQDLNSSILSSVYLGIDIGSTSTKAVLMDNNCEVLCGLYTRTAGRPLLAVQNIFHAIDEIEENHNIRFKVLNAGTTGSGRKFIGNIIGADSMIDEITAHARAAYQLNPEVDTIIEIGGQDAKFTTLKNGGVTSSTMNNVCAAGTGSFIEEQAAKLGCTVTEYSTRTEGVRSPMTSDRCTVFMERDMNHFLTEGYTVEEVLASALHSVRENYLLKVANEKNIGSTIFFQGATAKNKALVAAFEQRLKKPILVSKFCHLTGALGTALIIREECSSPSSFKGIGLHKKSIPVTNEVCDLCANHCKISIAEIDHNPVAYGFLCGRDYQTKKFVKTSSTAFDLLAERRKAFHFSKCKHDTTITIGLPAAVHLVDELQLWKKFFDLLGIKSLSSEKYTDGVNTGKKLTQSEFCSPINSMHGHTKWLLDRVDYVFLPTYLENKAKDCRRHYCYYTQFLPALISNAPEINTKRILRPIIKYLYTSFHTKIQLFRMVQQISGVRKNFLEISSAYDRAVEFDRKCRAKLNRLFKPNDIDSKDDISVVFLGRPYSLFSPTMNGNIPDIFNKLGIDCYYQDMLEKSRHDLSSIKPLLREIHWEHAAKIIEATAVVANSENLYPVLVTSFKCSPDSFTVDYFRSILDHNSKPYLILELDEHDSSIGYETRIEAAIRAFRNHRHGSKTRIRAGLTKTQNNDLIPTYCSDLKGKHILFPNWDKITGSFLTSTLIREGYDAHLLEETEETIRESLRHNSGQCIPLNAVAQGAIQYVRNHNLDPARTVLWLNKSFLACNIRLYPCHIQKIFKETGNGFEKLTIYQGDLSFADVSIGTSKNAYFSYMIGGMLRKICCKIRPYEVNPGETDRVLRKSTKVLSDAFAGKRNLEKSIEDVVSKFEWIETEVHPRPKIAIFGDLYSRDNSVMNQNLIRFIESQGGEVITTPYNEYAKMIAGSYFRKWFNEGKYFDVLTSKALLAAMQTLEKRYKATFNRILNEPDYVFDDKPLEILTKYNICAENSGESMDNILKIHYIHKYHPEVTLLVQASPALCCASLVTESMRKRIEQVTNTPVVSVTYDGTGGFKNDVIVPYLKYRRKKQQAKDKSSFMMVS